MLALSGDYPVDGFAGDALPVFDTDSVGMLEMIRRMNAGMSVTLPGRRASESVLSATRFCPGAAVNPFKLHEGEYLTAAVQDGHESANRCEVAGVSDRLRCS